MLRARTALVPRARSAPVLRTRTVLVLRPFRLAVHGNAGGDVGDADGGLGLVHVLPAGATRAHGLDAQVLLVDLHPDGLVDVGIDEDAGEGGVAARL